MFSVVYSPKGRNLLYLYKTHRVETTKRHIEALIFAAKHPVNITDIQTAIEESLAASFEVEFIQSIIDELQQYYATSGSAYEIVQINDGYRFLTKSEYHHTINCYLKQTAGKKLSNAALETLAIVAYKQPVAKTEIESIRGVNSDYLMQKLLDKELIQITGREESPGRPLLYGTSEKFMDYFGLKSLKDLPKLKEFQIPENTIGAQESASNN